MCTRSAAIYMWSRHLAKFAESESGFKLELVSIAYMGIVCRCIMLIMCSLIWNNSNKVFYIAFNIFKILIMNNFVRVSLS